MLRRIAVAFVLATVLNLSATAWSFVSSEPPDDSGLPAEILTAPSVFEAAGYLSFIDANHLGIIEHIYTWRHPAGASLRAALSGLDDGYLALFDPSGTLVREADDPYGEGEVHLETGPLAAGEYAIRVTTASGDGTGRYALRVWPDGSGGGQGASAPGTPTGALARVRSDRNMVRSFGPLPLDVLREAHLPAGTRIAEYTLPALSGTEAVDVWLFSDRDVDLYGAAVAGGVVLSDGASRGPYGYEHLRLPARVGAMAAAEFVVRVALYENYDGNVPVYVLARAAWAGSGSPTIEPEELSDPGEIWDRGERPDLGELRDLDGTPDPGALGGAGAIRRGPYAGRLEPGVRYRGEIRPGEYATQIWTFVVPEGAGRVEVGLFDAEEDLELSLEPGWAPSPGGLEHGIQALTRRWNDRIVLELDGEEFPAGLYTVLVWPAAAGVGGDQFDLQYDIAGALGPEAYTTYGIEIAVDGPLPASASYDGLAPGEWARVPGPDRVRLSAVWIESDFHWGGGAIISPSGLILTNYTAVADCHPRALAPVGCLEEEESEDPWYVPGEHLVWAADPRSGAFEQRFVAEVVDVLPEADLALLQIVRDVDGNPVFLGLAGADRVFPHLDVDPGDGGGGGGGSPAGGIVAVGFPERGSGRIETVAIDPRDVAFHEGPPPAYVIDAGAPAWHPGVLVAVPGRAVLIGLITDRHRIGSGEESWAVVPTTLVPRGWLRVD